MSIGTIARQYPLAAVVEVAFADISGETAVEVVELPAGAIVTGGQLLVQTAFDDTGTATVDIGDADDPDRFTASPVNVKATGSVPLDIDTNNAQYDVPAQITATLAAQNDDGTEGAFLLIVEYVVEGRQNENQ